MLNMIETISMMHPIKRRETPLEGNGAKWFDATRANVTVTIRDSVPAFRSIKC